MKITPWQIWSVENTAPPSFAFKKGAVLIGVGFAKATSGAIFNWCIYQFVLAQTKYVIVYQNGPLDKGTSIEQLIDECNVSPHPITYNWFTSWSKYFPISLVEDCTYATMRNACKSLPFFRWRWV